MTDFTHERYGPMGTPERDRPGYFHMLKLAPAWKRYASATIDYFLTLFLPLTILGAITDWIGHGGAIPYLVALGLIGYNSVWLASETGQSIGKKLLDIHMVQSAEYNGGPHMVYVPLPTAIMRELLQITNLWCFILVLMPAVHPYKATSGDALMKVLHFDGPVPFAIEQRPPGARTEWKN